MGRWSYRLNAKISSGSPPLRYHAFVPSGGISRPPVVVVHGNGRAATEQFRAFLPYAMALDIPLLAPLFSRQKFAGYQRLAGADGPLTALYALEATLEDARQSLGVATDFVNLVGFSGGAQFVHRYALLAPGRVLRLVVASAGWYTYLDADRPFPSGCAPSDESGGLELDTDAFLRLPIRVLVGELDVEQDDDLRKSPRLDTWQGPHRLARAMRWVAHLEAEARMRGITPQVSFELLPDTGHSFSQAASRGHLIERSLNLQHPSPSAVRDSGRDHATHEGSIT